MRNKTKSEIKPEDFVPCDNCVCGKKEVMEERETVVQHVDEDDGYCD